jgi:hypothetical protein
MKNEMLCWFFGLTGWALAASAQLQIELMKAGAIPPGNLSVFRLVKAANSVGEPSYVLLTWKYLTVGTWLVQAGLFMALVYAWIR